MKAIMFFKRNWGRILLYSILVLALIDFVGKRQESQKYAEWQRMMDAGRSYVKTQRFAKAIESFNKAIDLSQSMEIYRQKAGYRGLVSMYYEWGHKLLLERNYDACLETFQKALGVLVKHDANSYRYVSDFQPVLRIITESNIYQRMYWCAKDADRLSEAEYYLIQTITAKELESDFEPSPMSDHAYLLKNLAEMCIENDEAERLDFVMDKMERLGYEERLKEIMYR